MVHFNELRFSEDNKYLIIDASVNTEYYYDNIIINNIVVDNQDTYINNGPSSTPLFNYNVVEEHNKIYSPPEDCICSPIKVENDEYCYVEGLDLMKNVRIKVPVSLCGINPTKDMLFVYVITSGTPSSDTPCGFDNYMSMGVVLDLKSVYSNILYYVRQVEDECKFPKDFVDTILKYKALEASIKTGNYPLAIKYWNKYIANSKHSYTI